MDSAGRLWATGSQLAVAVPGTLTAYRVVRTPDLIAAAADGPGIWADTGSTLIRLQADTGSPGPCSEVCSGGYGPGEPAVPQIKVRHHTNTSHWRGREDQIVIPPQLPGG